MRLRGRSSKASFPRSPAAAPASISAPFETATSRHGWRWTPSAGQWPIARSSARPCRSRRCESAGGEDLGELRARLVELRLTEAPEGIEEAELAAAELQEALQPAPRMASVGYLDAIGLAAARLEQALGQMGGSPFAEAMRSGMPAADELATEVIRSYKGSLA
jgi:hypothetical protein